MRRSTRRRVSLLLAIIVLAALAAWQWQRQQRQHPTSLLDIDPAGITHIEVSAQGGPVRVFDKRDGHWVMSAPKQGRANDEHIDKLTEIANAKVLRWRPRSDFDPANIGLLKPFAILRLDQHTLRFGAIAALAPQRYVALGDHIALIPARFGAALAATVDSELAHASSAAPPSPSSVY